MGHILVYNTDKIQKNQGGKKNDKKLFRKHPFYQGRAKIPPTFGRKKARGIGARAPHRTLPSFSNGFGYDADFILKEKHFSEAIPKKENSCDFD